jgi:hypothetical protein
MYEVGMMSPGGGFLVVAGKGWGVIKGEGGRKPEWPIDPIKHFHPTLCGWIKYSWEFPSI